MTEYENINEAVAGLKHGLNSRVISKVAAEDLPLGYPLFALKGNDESIGLLNNDESVVLYDADFVALNNIEFNVTRPGPNDTDVTSQVNVVFDTDQATTLAALVAAVDAIDGIDAAGTGVREITVNSDDGAAITVTTVVTLGVSQAGATVTPANSGNQTFRGVSMLTQTNPVPYKSGDMVNVFLEGGIWIYVGSDCVSQSPVYYDANGEFNKAGTAVADAIFETDLAAAGLARITINKP